MYNVARCTKTKVFHVFKRHFFVILFKNTHLTCVNCRAECTHLYLKFYAETYIFKVSVWFSSFRTWKQLIKTRFLKAQLIVQSFKLRIFKDVQCWPLHWNIDFSCFQTRHFLKFFLKNSHLTRDNCAKCCAFAQNFMLSSINFKLSLLN